MKKGTQVEDLQVGEIKSQPATTIFKFRLLTDETSDHHTDDVRIESRTLTETHGEEEEESWIHFGFIS